MVRVLDFVFFIYFATHIPITILVDFQSLLPQEYYPQTLLDLKSWYCGKFRDPLMLDPPPWFKSLVTCELFVQLPFFPIATYGYFKGAEKCQWLRLPMIIYGTHVATTLIPIFFHVFSYDFTHDTLPGPTTVEERLFLASIYSPYFIIPILLVFDALFSSVYTSKTNSGNVKNRALKSKKRS